MIVKQIRSNWGEGILVEALVGYRVGRVPMRLELIHVDYGCSRSYWTSLQICCWNYFEKKSLVFTFGWVNPNSIPNGWRNLYVSVTVKVRYIRRTALKLILNFTYGSCIWREEFQLWTLEKIEVIKNCNCFSTHWIIKLSAL